jgi:hypothetical protein
VSQISLYFTGKSIEEKIISLDKAYHQNENLHKLFEEILTLKHDTYRSPKQLCKKQDVFSSFKICKIS